MVNIKKTLITGGGSGGHVSVASGLIDGIKNRNIQLYQNIIYVGGDLGMVKENYGNSLEQRKFRDVDFKTRYIRAGKLQRHLSLTTIKLLLRTILGFLDALKILSQEKPDIIFSSGGFVSVPVCTAGWLKRIPIYLHEQTAAVGLANRIVGMFAKRIYIAFDSSRKYFKEEKTLLVGNIVRRAITSFEIQNVSENIKKVINRNTQYPLLYISGGGLGSHTINEKIFAEIETLLSDYRIILQTGDNKHFKDYEKALDIKEKLTEEHNERFLPIKFINDDNIGYVYANTDLFIGRAGANTVYEMGVLSIPSLFIPIPWVTNNEQFKNAKTLIDIGLAKIIEEIQFEKVNLKERIDKEINNLPKSGVDYSNLKKKFPLNAVEKVLNDMYT